MNLKHILQEAHQTAIEKGWWDNPRNFAEELALIHEEVSEALGEYRKFGLSPETFLYNVDGKPEGIAAELADVIIRTRARAMESPWFLALHQKLEYNHTRPHRHGGKVC